MRTISQCFGISAARAQADMDLSLSGGNDRWHASSSMTLLLAVGATTEAAPEAAHAPGAEDAEAAREDAASLPEAMAEDAEAQGEATADPSTRGVSPVAKTWGSALILTRPRCRVYDLTLELC